LNPSPITRSQSAKLIQVLCSQSPREQGDLGGGEDQGRFRSCLCMSVGVLSRRVKLVIPGGVFHAPDSVTFELKSGDQLLNKSGLSGLLFTHHQYDFHNNR
jgi:hypothetical protein